MLGPYRTLAEADPASDACTANPHDGRFTGACCCATTQQPPRFAAVITHAYGAPMRPPAIGYARALTAAATLLLLVASASLGAVSWSVVASQFRYPAGAPILQITAPSALLPVAGASLGTTRDTTRPPPPRLGPPMKPSPAPQHPTSGPTPPPPKAAPVPPHTLLAHLGPETHVADELWRRAEHLAASRSDVTLVRTTLARQTAGTMVGSGLRILHDREPAGSSGVLVLEAGDASSAPALAGLRPGDRVEAVNGFRLDAPGDVARAFDAIDAGRSLVVEIVRGGRRIALRVDWRA